MVKVLDEVRRGGSPATGASPVGRIYGVGVEKDMASGPRRSKDKWSVGNKS